jgi:HlyD family type I secretion membrane fusion protein
MKKENQVNQNLTPYPLFLTPTINFGLKALGVFLVIFLSWAAFLPIKSASIADGVVVLDFNRKTIQHLEGGMIDQILVKEGQNVKAGDILLYLHDIRAKAERQILEERLWTMQLQKERLKAEKENHPSLNLSEFFSETGELPKSDEEKLQKIAANQLRLFKARKDKRQGEIKVLEKKLKAAETKLKIFQKELSLIKPLVDEDNLPVLRELDLQKAIAETDEQAESARLQIANYKNNDLAEILKELKESDMEIIGLHNQLAASKDVLKRSAITSPVSGKIMNIKYHTIGAVVPPGGEIMNIVPQHEELIIEAKIKPQDIDNVTSGLKAKVMLTAYKGKKVPKLNGEVLNISPDIFTDAQTKESYFLARVAVSKKDIEKLKNKIELYPGMPAQVFVITGSRSLVSDLFTPISDSAYKAFREE